MIRPLYVELLSQEEHRTALEQGVKMACALRGIDKSAFNPLDMVSKAVVTFSVLTGVPLGVAGHLLHRAMKSDTLAQREQRAKIKYYRDVTNELEQGLMGPKADTKLLPI